MFEYILREIFLSVIAFLAGAGVSAGVFAFVLVIGVVPRILRCSRIENIILIENVMICGVVAGNISSVLGTAYNLGFGKYAQSTCKQYLWEYNYCNIWIVCRHICRLYCSCTRRNTAHIPYYI